MFHPVVVTVWLLLWAIRVFGAPLLSVYIAALALKPVAGEVGCYALDLAVLG